MSLSRTLGGTWILPGLCILVSATSFADTRLSIQHTDQDNMPDGFPVHVRHFGSNGQATSEQQVQSVTHDGLYPALFEIPAGYEKRELPTLPQQ